MIRSRFKFTSKLKIKNQKDETDFSKNILERLIEVEFAFISLLYVILGRSFIWMIMEPNKKKKSGFFIKINFSVKAVRLLNTPVSTHPTQKEKILAPKA